MLKVATPRKRTPASPSHARFLLLMLRMAALAAPALLSGCLDWGAAWNNGAPGGATGSPNMPMSTGGHLPEPLRRKYPPPELDAAGQQRADAVEAFLLGQYLAAGWQIMATIQTESGDIYDWMDPSSVEGSDIEPPPPPTPEEMQLPDGVERQLTELDTDPDVKRLAGLIPVLRPDFAAYVLGDSGASSLDDFLTNDVVPGDPSGGKGYLYAGMRTIAPNRGANASISAFGGNIEEHTMSLLEMVVGCRNATDPTKAGQMWQYIGIAASRDYVNQNFVNFGDGTLRLQVEFFTAGTDPKALGPKNGGWHGTRTTTDFKPVKGTPYAPSVAFTPEMISTIGGTQRETLFQIKWRDGNWWVGFNGHWLGYFPKELFDAHPPNLIAEQACEVNWYGEVFAKTEKLATPWTWTDMGSGQFAEKGLSKAAYFRDPSYVRVDAGGLWSWPDSDPKVETKNFLPTEGYNPACYTQTTLGSGAAPWERYFYVGGPGGPSLIPGDGSPTCK